MQALATLSLAALSSRASALVVAPVDLALHQQRQAFVEAQLGRRGGLVAWSAMRGDHAVQAQAAQLVRVCSLSMGRSPSSVVMVVGLGGQW